MCDKTDRKDTRTAPKRKYSTCLNPEDKKSNVLLNVTCSQSEITSNPSETTAGSRCNITKGKKKNGTHGFARCYNYLNNVLTSFRLSRLKPKVIAFHNGFFTAKINGPTLYAMLQNRPIKQKQTN